MTSTRLLLAFTLASSLSGVALGSDCSYTLEPELEPTYFRQLETMFARGTTACGDTTTAWQTMRCYEWSGQNTPRGGLLAFDRWRDQTAFQPIDTISPYFGDSPNYYDQVDADLEIWIDDFLGARWQRYSPAHCVDRSLVSVPEWVDVSYHLRRSGDYLVMKTIDEGSYRRPGETKSMCYAFAPVQRGTEAASPEAAVDLDVGYDETGVRYDRGELPTREELAGWWSGRCYLEADHETRFASLLSGEDAGVLGDHGPLGAKTFKLNHLIGSSRLAPDWFDALDAHRTDVAQRSLSAHARAVNGALEISGSLASTEVGLECVEYQLRVRRDGASFYGRMIVADEEAETGEREIGRCYWFGNVGPGRP